MLQDTGSRFQVPASSKWNLEPTRWNGFPNFWNQEPTRNILEPGTYLFLQGRFSGSRFYLGTMLSLSDERPTVQQLTVGTTGGPILFGFAMAVAMRLLPTAELLWREIKRMIGERERQPRGRGRIGGGPVAHGGLGVSHLRGKTHDSKVEQRWSIGTERERRGRRRWRHGGSQRSLARWAPPRHSKIGKEREPRRRSGGPAAEWRRTVALWRFTVNEGEREALDDPR